jgi:hypothetical protein
MCVSSATRASAPTVSPASLLTYEWMLGLGVDIAQLPFLWLCTQREWASDRAVGIAYRLVAGCPSNLGSIRGKGEKYFSSAWCRD